jgi:hypothetical protein
LERRLTALERRFRVHLVPYAVAGVSDSFARDVHLCQIYRKATYSRGLARTVEALQRTVNGKLVVVAYRKPWQREFRYQRSSRSAAVVSGPLRIELCRGDTTRRRREEYA